MNGPGQLKRVCVYCGSQTGQATAYREVAWSVGERLAQQGIEVV
ncbi:hypothetical protein [Chloracidobacterium aggregatum]|nr:hypothetical protein [Chloracidobacterium aggregatum]